MWETSKSYEISNKRGQWLRKHNLFRKAEEHFKQMKDWYGERIGIQQALGHMLMRQGKLFEAKTEFELSLSQAKKDGDLKMIAVIEKNLGQVIQAEGKWDEALVHYGDSFHAATTGGSKDNQASIYINRGYLYSLKGHYHEAIQQCRSAIKLLKDLPDNPGNKQRAIYAQMNLGTVYRHSGDYFNARETYNKSLELANNNNDTESICYTLQHMGINEHLWGRNIRRVGGDLSEACAHQVQAWKLLVESLNQAQHSEGRNVFANGLNRLGKVYREIHRLETLALQSGQEIQGLLELTREASAYQPPLEVEYEYDLLTTKSFSAGNWLEKSARLFEISALLASNMDDFHRALDSWVESATLFEELDLDDKVPFIIRRIERLKGYDYQEDLFSSINEVISGHLDFKHNKRERACQKYMIAYANVADNSGSATYVLVDRLRELEHRMESLPAEIALAWCDEFEKEWMRRGVLVKRPEMWDALERIRLNAMQHKR
jgi:tetratricopeptide (TPR) repeat protein